MKQERDLSQVQEELEQYLALGEPEDPDKLAKYLHDVAQCYYHMGRFQEELPLRERLIRLAPTRRNYNNLGVAYSGCGLIEPAAEAYTKSMQSKDPTSVSYSNFMILTIRNHLFDTAFSIHPPPHDYKGRLEVIINFANACIKNDRLDAFEFTADITISNLCPDYGSNFIVKAIFDTTHRLKDRSQIRVCLLDLYDKVLSLKNEQKVDLTKEAVEICHYTRVENLKHLVKPAKRGSSPAYLRLFNAAYMNDPSEGKVFDRLMLRCSGCEMRQSDSDHQRGNRIYHSYGYSSTYLGSFSASVDSLPMWVQYGNGGLGCCLIFDTDFFDKDEPFGDPESLGLAVPDSEEQAASAEVKEKDRYVLYKVEYISEDGDYRHKDILCHIAELYHEIDGLTDRLAQSSQEKIRRIADNILDQIRFLFKEEDYAHEQEYRVVKSSFAPLCDEGARSGEVPHLYIEFKRPLRYKEVILGPKVKDPSEVAPYLHYTGKVKRITKSLVKYQ